MIQRKELKEMRIEEFEKQINDVINLKEKELDELTSKKEQTEEETTKAKELISKAKKDNDFKTYNKAKQKLWELENSLEFYQERIEMVKAPIPADEYFNYFKTLDRILGEEMDKVLEEAEPLIKQLEYVLDKERDTYIKAMRLGDKIQSGLMDKRTVLNGTITEFRTRQNPKTQMAIEKVYIEHRYKGQG